MVTQPKHHHNRWTVVLISLFTVPFQLLNAEEAGNTGSLLDSTNGDAEHHHSPSSTEAVEIDDDEGDLLPAWFAYLLALVLFCISMLLCFTLLFWGDKLENEKDGAKRKASTAAEQKRKESVGHVVRSRRWSSFLDHPMSPTERWVIAHHAVIRNFICSALVFFATPNLVIMGGLQQNFEVTLFGVLIQKEVELLKTSNKRKDEDMKQFKAEMIIFKSQFEQAMNATTQNESIPPGKAPNRLDSKRESKGLSQL